jgi:hypothetical protein
MPGITSKDMATYKPFVSSLSAICRDAEVTKKPIQAIGLTTLLMIGGIHAQSITSESETLRSFIEPVAKNQRLDIKRIDLKIIARIREIGMYPNGWDNANANAASKKAVDDAENFIRQLLPVNIKEPIISLAADGEINFLWILPDFRLDLGVYGDGSYSYYGKASNGEEFIADVKSIDEKLPNEIIAAITNRNIH